MTKISSSSGTVVQHLVHNPKIGHLKPVTGNTREKKMVKSLNIIDRGSGTVVDHSTYNHEMSCLKHAADTRRENGKN